MSISERICKGCGITEQTSHLDRCGVCSRYFCPECSHRAYGGRKFCSPECARGYYFQGEIDDDDEDRTEH